MVSTGTGRRCGMLRHRIHIRRLKPLNKKRLRVTHDDLSCDTSRGGELTNKIPGYRTVWDLLLNDTGLRDYVKRSGVGPIWDQSSQINNLQNANKYLNWYQM